MPLINCKVYLELNWIEVCIFSSARDTAKFAITDPKLHVPIFTLSTKDSVNFTKQLNEGFKRSVYWNRYEKNPAKVIEQGKNIYELLNASLQGVKRLFVLAYFIIFDGGNDEADIKSNKKYFLRRVKIENYNVLIDGRNFHDQPINDIIKQYDEVRKVSKGYGDDYTTGCLFDYAYFKGNYKLIAVDLSKKKLQMLIQEQFSKQYLLNTGVVEGDGNTKIRLYTIVEPSKETILEFSKGTTKVLQIHVNG